MITANIDHSLFILDSITDAEQLLRIFSNAQRVTLEYDSATRTSTFVSKERNARVEISVHHDQPVVSAEQYMKQHAPKIQNKK